MENLDPGTALTVAAGILGAIVLFGNALEKIENLIKAFKAPNAKQDQHFAEIESWKSEIESWKDEVNRKLNSDYDHLRKLDDGNRISQRALLALLGHGIDGNNLKEMETAKEELHNHLFG